MHGVELRGAQRVFRERKETVKGLAKSALGTNQKGAIDLCFCSSATGLAFFYLYFVCFVWGRLHFVLGKVGKGTRKDT